MNHSPAYLLGRLIFEIDRAADQLLQAQVGISYKRATFLIVLQHGGTVTQHELAVALGYSDPAVSMMLVELAKDDYIQITKSPEHGRKRLVTITAKGSEVMAQARQLLDAHFDQLMEAADVDVQLYCELTERLHQALIAKMKKEK
ncbi:MAG TPA: MarR family winged helix-turn-helix transcriptional regulator [Ktedonobacteraceae bacterium]|jgi:DNA-binding MarR family transcriptional regulator|nr:MarR family winged helix-turn-helix transcriptional regulator [Ktedonobacteraceae bacterium]